MESLVRGVKGDLMACWKLCLCPRRAFPAWDQTVQYQGAFVMNTQQYQRSSLAGWPLGPKAPHLFLCLLFPLLFYHQVDLNNSGTSFPVGTVFRKFVISNAVEGRVMLPLVIGQPWGNLTHGTECLISWRGSVCGRCGAGRRSTPPRYVVSPTWLVSKTSWGTS